jgi:hypothetical protein
MSDETEYPTPEGWMISEPMPAGTNGHWICWWCEIAFARDGQLVMLDDGENEDEGKGQPFHPYCVQTYKRREYIDSIRERLRPHIESYETAQAELEQWWEKNPITEPHPNRYYARTDAAEAIAELVPGLLRALDKEAVA